MRGLKGSVYRGGIRVPFWIKYPELEKRNIEIDATATNIDLLPTIAGICKAGIPATRKIDGISLLPFIDGKKSAENRPLFFYWTRHSPELYSNIALQKGRYKLVGNTDFDASVEEFQLYNIDNDPYEQNNIIKKYPERADELKKELDLVFADLAGSPNLIDRPAIEVGTIHENPVILNRNDADGQWGVWEQEEIFGMWRIKINEGKYNLRFKFIKPVPAGGKMMVETGAFINQMKNEINETDLIEMKNVHLPSLKCDFVPFYLTGGRRILPLYIEIEKIE